MNIKPLSFLLVFLFLCTTYIQSQNIEVKGVVKSTSDNESLPGVSILVKTTSNGTMSGLDGDYTLQNVPQDAVLVFSYLGFKTQEVSVKGRTTIDVMLLEDSQLLNEVVAVGYRTERKTDLTGAVSVVDIKDMMSESGNNPIKNLQGRIPGMQVTSDGNPSGSANVVIRGGSSWNNGDPSYIIDGVPSTAGMHELNSNDIESVQVLRDASAASIYGSRAANGVIIVTTKKGKTGVMSVNFDAYLTASFYGKKMKVLNSKQYAQALGQANLNDGNNPNSNNLGIVYDLFKDNNGHTSISNIYYPEYLGNGLNVKPADTNWFDEISQTGILQSYNLSVSNGTDKSSRFFSLGYLDNGGVIKHTDFSRISLRLNNDYKLLDGLVTIGENFTLNRTSEVSQPYQIQEAAFIAVPFLPTDANGTVNGTPDRQNPARLVYDNRDNRYCYWRALGNAYININPIKGLNIRSNFGLDYGNFYKRVLTYSYNDPGISNSLTKSSLEQAHWTKWTLTNTATYDFQIDKHRFETLLGQENKRYSLQTGICRHSGRRCRQMV